MDRRRAAAFQVLAVLEKRSFLAYLVGGCVRDILSHKVPLDYDIATSALPNEVLSCFPHSIPTGIQHGTVTVCVDDTFIEVTTFRTEAKYLDRRRPSQVTFVTSLADDLSRRDFTINAMAMDRRGNLYDYFGGQEDLRRLRLRTVGPASDRFREDALRMVRAARFVTQLGVTVDPVAEQAMLALRNLCRHLAVERTVAEIEKMWKATRPAGGVRILFRCGLTSALLPFAHWPETDVDLIPLLDRVQDVDVRWCILLACFCTTAEQVASRLRALKLSNIKRARIGTCYHLSERVQPWEPVHVKMWLLKEGLESVQRVALFAYHLGRLTREDVRRVPLWWDELHIHTIRQLRVTGGELLQRIGKEPGPWVRSVLQQLFEEVALGHLPNDPERLFWKGERLSRDHSI